MTMYLPDEGGWPYPDGGIAERMTDREVEPFDGFFEEVDALADEPFDPYDDDAVALHAYASHLLDDLDPVERMVVAARFGIGGPVRSMRNLHQELHLPRAQLREALGSGLAKIRSHLVDG